MPRSLHFWLAHPPWSWHAFQRMWPHSSLHACSLADNLSPGSAHVSQPWLRYSLIHAHCVSISAWSPALQAMTNAAMAASKRCRLPFVTCESPFGAKRVMSTDLFLHHELKHPPTKVPSSSRSVMMAFIFVDVVETRPLAGVEGGRSRSHPFKDLQSASLLSK